jgi:hypothetical protein
LTAAALENAAVLAQAAVLGDGARPARAAILRGVECSELRQLGDEGGGEDWAAAGPAGKQGEVGGEGGVGRDPLTQEREQVLGLRWDYFSST